MTLEELQKDLLELKDKYEKLAEDNKSLNAIVEEKTKREKELEEHNQKLFLRITKEVNNTDKEEEKEIPFCVDDKTYKLLSEKEKDELNELIEEE